MIVVDCDLRKHFNKLVYHPDFNYTSWWEIWKQKSREFNVLSLMFTIDTVHYNRV